MPTINVQTRLLLTLVAASLGTGLWSEAGADDTGGQLAVDANFAGGNIIVDRVAGDTVHLHQDLRDTGTWWFYWNFRVRNAADRNIRFQFAGQSPIGVLGPAVSQDRGQSWTWLGSKAVKGNAFEFKFSADNDEVRFAFAMPYQRHDLNRFIASHAEAVRNGRLLANTLCRSRGHRDVPLLRLQARTNCARHRVLITARHHACESMASFVLEGLLDAWLAAPNSANNPMNDVEVVVVPLVDYDGVQDGDQGKNRKPRDHNRDYDGDGIYLSRCGSSHRVAFGLQPFPGFRKVRRIRGDLAPPWAIIARPLSRLFWHASPHARAQQTA